MNDITAPPSLSTRVAVRRGLPSLHRSPRITALVADIRARAADIGMGLHRFELVPENVVSPWQVDVYWVVALFPRNMRFACLGEARRMLSEQIHVRVSGGWDDTRDSDDVVAELDYLRWVVTRKVDRMEMGGLEPPDIDDEQEF